MAPACSANLDEQIVISRGWHWYITDFEFCFVLDSHQEQDIAKQVKVRLALISCTAFIVFGTREAMLPNTSILSNAWELCPTH